MSSVHNSVETVNAAATAIVTAESRVQPSAVQSASRRQEKLQGLLRFMSNWKKRRWGSCWSIYWCFGSYNKHSKRIGHAVLVSEPAAPGVVAPVSENRNHPSTIILPFIAPPSSPASFLQSDPSSSTQSPTGLLSLASLSVHPHSPGGTAPIFTIGPYAHETQLVSPPVFSTFTTEPSTASFTPPPEPMQMTTPSSPEVPFAELLSSSLAARNRRNSGNNLKYSFSQYEFQPYQYPGSPGGHIKSPGSAISTSGTSSPFPDKRPIIEFRAGEVPKFFGYEHIPSYKWDSRVGSGSLTPNGWGSRLGSGALTPNNVGEPPSRDSNLLENQIDEVASLANSDNKSQHDDVVIDHRVSFELFGEDIPTCIVREPSPSDKYASGNSQEKKIAEATNKEDLITDDLDSHSQHFNNERAVSEVDGITSDGEVDDLYLKHRTVSLGSSKDFNFNNAKEEVSEKSSTIDCEWWTNEKVVREELGPRNRWSFFPMLQSEAR